MISADGATCASGGLVGAIQTLGGTLAPGASTTATFRIALPSARRFRFFVNVLGCVGGGARGAGEKSRLLAGEPDEPFRLEADAGRSRVTVAARSGAASPRHQALPKGAKGASGERR